MAEFIKLEVTDGVGVLTLNRPDRLNAIGNDMGFEFDEMMVKIAQDPDIRVVILTGAGRAFCAGADMERLSGFAESKGASLKAPEAGEVRGKFKAIEGTAPAHLLTRYNSPQALPQPVIAAVNGPAAGVGFSIALMCDLRFASTAAFFTAPFAKRGLPAETGTAVTLTSLVGFGKAADIFYSARRVQADEALRIGLVERVFEPEKLMEETIAYAKDIVANVSPRSIRIMKRQLWTVRNEAFAAAATLSHAETKAAMSTEDFAEGLAHFKEKRPARFTGK